MKTFFIIGVVNALLLISSSFLFISCDNSANNSVLKSNSDSVKSDAEVNGIHYFSIDSIPVVFLDAESILDLDINTNKVVYQFYIPDTTFLTISLEMYPLIGNRYNDPIPLKISPRFVKFDFSGKKVVFGDQLLRNNQLRRLKAKLESNTNLAYVVFIPQQDPVNYHIYYRIYLFTKAEFESWRDMPVIFSLKDVEINAEFFDDTNPSPPAPPSES